MIDLHIHSTASDGSLSPAEILDEAVDLNLAAISIVDHDTLEGSKEAAGIDFPSRWIFRAQAAFIFWATASNWTTLP
jgi:histidinol phosphatase-like PHP family hydrolase